METYISFLILSCLQKIKGERTIYSIFHLLKGKKSSQTIQDAHLFQLTYMFQTFPQLNRQYFAEIINELEREHLIQNSDDEKYALTKKGLTILKEKRAQITIPKFLNGWKYHSIQDDFWKRLSLLVQVSSNLINHDASYIPIQNDSKSSTWLKTTLRKLKLSRENLARELLYEIINCLSSESDINPRVVIWRLTGYKRIGLTTIQAAEELKMDPAFYQLEFLNTLHFMIEKIIINKRQFPILYHLLFDFNQSVVLTHSSALTHEYLHLGYNIAEIAKVRNLKTSTIEDHLVEIILNDKDFKLSPFVSMDTQAAIRKSISKLSSKQLKTIRKDLNQEVTYFQIRLVLARFGDQI